MAPLLTSVVVVCRAYSRLSVLPGAAYIIEAYIEAFWIDRPLRVRLNMDSYVCWIVLAIESGQE